MRARTETPALSHSLQQAHISLILKKGYEAITVEDICETANVGRSTFYAHYTSKDDLRRGGLENLRRQLVGRQKEALAKPGDTRDRCLGFNLAMFEHARDHMDLYRALVGDRGGCRCSWRHSPDTFRFSANSWSNMSLVLSWP
jgi:AcrR family transcriptional regulator